MALGAVRAGGTVHLFDCSSIQLSIFSTDLYQVSIISICMSIYSNDLYQVLTIPVFQNRSIGLIGGWWQLARFALAALDAVRTFRKEDGSRVRKPYNLFVPRVLAFVPGGQIFLPAN